MDMKTPTIQDVTRFAQVSTATVSRALSSPARVRKETRARVAAAVEATGYILNQAGRSLRQRTVRTILVGLPGIRNSFFSTILDAIEREAALRGYGVLVANRFSGDDPARRLREYVCSKRADGLLLLDGTLQVEELIALARESLGVPIVIACDDIPNSPFHTVKTDNEVSAERATTHLIQLGHRAIGHISGPTGDVLRQERLAGFTRALE